MNEIWVGIEYNESEKYMIERVCVFLSFDQAAEWRDKFKLLNNREIFLAEEGDLLGLTEA